MPITGAFHSFEALHMDKVVLLLVELLECWIYKNFPSIAKSIAAEDYDERKPSVCHRKSGKALPVSTYRKRLDRLMSDALGDPPIVHDDTFVELDIPQHPVAVAAMDEAPADAPGHLEQPQHATEACQAIVERLERLLNLRIVTEGTKAYNVMDLWIVRGLIADRSVYV
ncbi:hypothetical protein GmHk_07G019079 [Glycine max]|nr:hypothetical protein GmHk_07G019079 [Glycine max]